jgi:hypothetical protein
LLPVWFDLWQQIDKVVDILSCQHTTEFPPWNIHVLPIEFHLYLVWGQLTISHILSS